MRDVAARHPEAERAELWFEDEAGVGQKGRVTHVWHARGLRPRGVREQRFASAYVFGAVCPARSARRGPPGAVCPARSAGVALVLPNADTAAMDLMLAELACALPAGTHAVLVLDRAGWHLSADLRVPVNLTLVHLPPHAPELNPVEKARQHLRDRWLSLRVLPGYAAVLDAACGAWNGPRAEPGRLRSLTSFPRLPSSVATS